MYAAAGGASIASRRKQKRLQLYKRGAEGGLGTIGKTKTTSTNQTATRTTTSTTTTNKFARQHQHQHQHHHHYHHHHHHQHQHHHHHHQHQHQHHVPPSFAAQAPQSSQFHTGIDRQQRSRVEKCQQLAPVSPIQFPISPPPLSLESSGSVTCATSKPNSFPFPPPSILDLRISPTSTPELQVDYIPIYQYISSSTTNSNYTDRNWDMLVEWDLLDTLSKEGEKEFSTRKVTLESKERCYHYQYSYYYYSYYYFFYYTTATTTATTTTTTRKWKKRQSGSWRSMKQAMEWLQCQGAGKVAWQGCNRSSPLPLFPNLPHGCRGGDGYKTKQCEAHRRWMKRNRIRDASYCYGSSGEDDDDDISGSVNRRRAEVNAAVNTVLYAGLGATALGLVISFVGTGEKGFLSPELKLIGPSLLCAGLLCCLFRVLLCLCLCRCGECRWCLCKQSRNKKEKEKQKTETRPSGPMQTASLLSPVPQQPATHSSCQVSSSAKGHELLLSPAQLPE
uniref:Uncharacterized protein n=1 Tax=Vespula pensylvanica TaxID=30213 RepID=A0A834P9J3_VESPE|nr:hypothetical protein H0235_002139 [Vespula pensylvanica]